MDKKYLFPIALIGSIVVLAAVLITTGLVKAQAEKKCNQQMANAVGSCSIQLGNQKKKYEKEAAAQQVPPSGPAFPSGPNFSPFPGAIPPGAVPVNQITHGYTTDWRIVGYVFSKDSNSTQRFPLYSRKNLYYRHLYDYMVIDNSRNRVRINIDLPKNQSELYDGDEIRIDSEPGKWIVRIDIPADYQYLPFLGPN